MKNQLFTLGLMASLCVSSVNAKMTRAELEQLAGNADKVRIGLNVVAPAALVACELNQEAPFSNSTATIATGVNQALKSAGMVAHAALETEASLVAELSDTLSTLAFADRLHIFIAAAVESSGSDASKIAELLTVMAVSEGVTRVIADVASVLICRKVNAMIKEKYAGASSMVQRRALRTVTFAVTKTVAHMLTVAVASLAAGYNLGIGAKGFNCFNFELFIRDTLLPVVNYAAAEFSAHALAQELIAAEALAAA